MADYPEVARRMKTDLNSLFGSAIVRLRDFHARMYPGTTAEEAAEATAIAYVEHYTRLGDSRSCSAVSTWKTLDDWPAHDSDFRVTLRSGRASHALILKVVITTKGSTWFLKLHDWSDGGNHQQTEKGNVVAESGRVLFVPNRRTQRGPTRTPARGRDSIPA